MEKSIVLKFQLTRYDNYIVICISMHELNFMHRHDVYIGKT